MIIYKTTNLINGKIYVGKDLKNDPLYFGSGIYLNRAITKYGKENFRKEIIEYCKTIEQLNEREIYWIKETKCQDPSVGYNIASGGDGGFVLKYAPAETIKQWREKISIKGRGRVVSSDTRKQIAKKHCGKKISDATKNKLRTARIKQFKDKYKQYEIYFRDIIRLNHEEKMPLTIISKKLELPINVVYAAFKLSGVKNKKYPGPTTYKPKPEIPSDIKKEIIRLYTEEQFLQTELQHKFNLTESDVKKVLDAAGIKTRSNKDKMTDRERQYRKTLKYSSELVKRVVDMRKNGATIDEIRVMYNIGYRLIKNILDEYQISSKKIR